MVIKFMNLLLQKVLRKTPVGILLFFMILGSFSLVAAQSNGKLIVSALEIDDFPSIHFYLEAFDEQGRFVNNIQTDQVQLLEDGYTRPIIEFGQVQPGLQIIIAINEAPMMTNHYGGIPQFDYLKQALLNWTRNLPVPSPGDFSLTTNSGLFTTHVANPMEFARTLESYQPELLGAHPDLTSLSHSLDLATDPLPDPHMKRAILYITPLPETSSLETLNNITERASQLGTYIFVWLLAPESYANSTQAIPLQQMAERTGGRFFAFLGNEGIPDPESHFAPLRYLYRLGYESGVNQSGEHQMMVIVTREDFQAASDEQFFSVAISPPNPMFLEPPTQVIRTWTDEENPNLTPDTVPVQILIEFPDGHERAIKRTTLYVNGEAVAENSEPPFEQFEWLISEHAVSDSLKLQVEVEDILELSHSSIETMVEMIIEEQERSWLDEMLSLRGIAIIVALLVAAAVLTLVIVLTGRRNLLARTITQRTQRFNDPVTQRVKIHQVSKAKKENATTQRTTLPSKKTRTPAPARLVWLSEEGHPMPDKVIQLKRREISLGSDPKQAIFVLNSPSVCPIHARLYQTTEGNFVLADSDSIAGTWVNYTPVPKAGVQLKHNDIIHLGRVAFRFELSDPNRLRQPYITSYNNK
jgi:hypothetical protein